MPAIESRAPWRRRRVAASPTRATHMNAKEWIAAYAEKLGTTPPSPQEFGVLLDVAGIAAHSSERVAAPVSCWVAARAGVSPGEALAAARELAGEDAGAGAHTEATTDRERQ